MSRALRVLIVILVLVFSLSTVAVVQVDAAPGVHQAGGVALVSSEPSAGVLSWFDAVVDYLRSLFGASCSDDPSQCDGGEMGPNVDSDG
jgi:hypothetical protein